MKRWSLLAMLMLLLSLALVACGGTANNTGGEEAAPAETGEEAAPTEEMAPAEEEAAAPAEGGEVECTDAIGCVEVAPGDPILLASALAISGDVAPLGTDSQRGVEIAIADRGDEDRL